MGFVTDYTKRFYRLEEAALLMGVHTDTVRRWTDTGQLQSVRTLGGHRRIPLHVLVKFGASPNA